VEPSFPVFAFAPPGVTWASISQTIDKLRGLRAEILAITDSGNPEAAGKAKLRLSSKLLSVATIVYGGGR